MNFEQVVANRKNKVIYRDGNKLVKLFDESYSVASVLNESLNQARIEETSLNIPRLQEVTKIDGKWAISMDFVEGKTLEQLMVEHPEKSEEYLNLFVDTQIDIHSKRSTLLRKLHDKMVDKIDETELEGSVKYDLKSRLAGFEKHNKVLHGDFQFSNVIVDNSGKVFIVDWAHATQGYASADAARTYLLFWLNGDIEGAKAYLDLFCSKSNTAKQYVQKWMPIVAASQSVKGNEKEREFLLSWVDVVDYE